MMFPSDKVEFVTSLTQWKQSVYGNSVSPFEWIEPLSPNVPISTVNLPQDEVMSCLHVVM